MRSFPGNIKTALWHGDAPESDLGVGPQLNPDVELFFQVYPSILSATVAVQVTENPQPGQDKLGVIK
jgi:hypothetical protein